MPSLLMSFRGFSEALLLLHNLATKRLEELRDSSQREHLGHCLEALTKCISMLYTAMQTTIKQPRNAEAQSAKKYILDHVDTTITDLISLVKSNLIESASTSQGYYVDKLQGLLQLLPSSRCSSITDSDFDSLLRDLVMHCMVVARASRKEWQLIVIKHCQHVLQLGTQISREARRLVKCYADSKQLQQDLEDNCASMKKELENLDSSMSSAIVYQMLDIFTAHDTALDELLGAATQASNIRGCGELDQLQPLLTAFLTHADLMIQVAGNISAGSTDTKAIENIETSRACLKWLRDNIVPNVLELGRSSPNASAVKRLQDLNHQWAEETRQLLGALHNVINIKQFTDLSVQEMMSDKAECQKAFEGQSADQFGEHAATLTARIKHVIDAGKRHVGKSDDPIFRNGLLVLVKQVETSASQATVAVQHCVKHFSNVKSFETFSEKVLEAIERIQILRDGLDGQLLQNVKVASENIQHCLNYIRDPRVRCTLRFVNEHLSFLTSDIVSRARHIVETQDLRDSTGLEIRTKDCQALSLTETALFLKRETDRCQEDDRIVKATKEMAAQIYDMVQYLKKKGPLKTQKEFIAAAKHIAVSGQKVSKFLHIIADLSLDGRCAEELLHIVEQIRTISSQLTIIARSEKRFHLEYNI
ncbi:CTNA1 protein, partial [Amia calva]|nr:CTNA1 protein [Amia calva]